MNDFFPLTHYFWLLDPVKGNEMNIHYGQKLKRNTEKAHDFF